MQFSKEETRFGEDISIAFTASPSSLCGYGVVDKSVFLHEGDNQLSFSKAFARKSQYTLNSKHV